MSCMRVFFFFLCSQWCAMVAFRPTCMRVLELERLGQRRGKRINLELPLRETIVGIWVYFSWIRWFLNRSSRNVTTSVLRFVIANDLERLILFMKIKTVRGWKHAARSKQLGSITVNGTLRNSPEIEFLFSANNCLDWWNFVERATLAN